MRKITISTLPKAINVTEFIGVPRAGFPIIFNVGGLEGCAHLVGIPLGCNGKLKIVELIRFQ